MINIITNRIKEFKILGKSDSANYIEFISSKSSYYVVRKKSIKNRYATLHFGGSIEGRIVLFILDIDYTSNDSADDIEDKLKEYAEDLLEDDILLNQIKPILLAVPKEIL